MRTHVMVYVALLFLLWGGGAAWAAPLARPVPPAQESETPAMNEPPQEPVAPPVPQRGQMLYENHCTSCHESVVHIRGNRRTKSLTELRRRVSQWATHLRLGWGMGDVEEVASFLNDHYYKFESRHKDAQTR